MKQAIRSSSAKVILAIVLLMTCIPAIAEIATMNEAINKAGR